MNYADLQTAPSGFPLTADGTLDFLQQSYLAGIRAVARMAGNAPVIVTGLLKVGTNYTDGWIYYDGDLVYFQAGSEAATFIIEETAVAATNQNGQDVNRYFTKIARFGTGTGQVAFSTLQRAGTLVELQQQAATLLSFEPAVILEGADVTGVSGSTTGTLSISAGTYVIDGQFVSALGYTGSFPVYFTRQGGYVTQQPSTGNYVTFNPHTSQRKADVLARATTKFGEIKQVAVLPTSFDSTGLGRWDWKGFALCNGANGTLDLRGRMGIGYDARSVDPGDGIWASNYRTPGATGGEKEVALALTEMPTHNHSVFPAGPLAQGQFGLIRKSVTGENRTSANTDTSQAGVEPDIVTEPIAIPAQGDGRAHENRPPFTVLVTVQRIA